MDGLCKENKTNNIYYDIFIKCAFFPLTQYCVVKDLNFSHKTPDIVLRTYLFKTRILENEGILPTKL